ncbi:phospholipase A [Hahella aquimaris]|uniref:phospholipase A n=1 Tax=Hahella sp. HNIBRBA332 TaxID=3015983 RepID=UPI00273B15F4|nr:phospholipase A [Hahella sp. HNIBRBA332]WLQ12159.1 phospholipase A [Hahella sp. HNIBRBA332]
MKFSKSAPNGLNTITFCCALTLGVNALPAQAQLQEKDQDETETCVFKALTQGPGDMTIDELKSRCGIEIPKIPEDASPTVKNGESVIAERIMREQLSSNSRSVITPHLRNYLMPVSYLKNPNSEPLREAYDLGEDAELDNLEAKFQISLKVPLAQGTFIDSDAIFFGVTLKSFWQVYNHDYSAPFRETNYEPEVFWIAPVDWTFSTADFSLLAVGFSHQSNGRSQPLSRSWNRIYANFIWEHNRFVFSLKPWWRIPEDQKKDRLDPKGDDNPDIDDYMGHFEFTTAYRWDNYEASLMLRNNLREDNKGAVELGFTFPLWKRLRGYVQYFNGYGENLMDYNASVERIGIGVLLTDLL